MKTKLLGCVGLCALVAAVYGQTLTFDFVRYDDPAYVTANEVVQRGLTIDGIRWAFTTGHFSNWHPLTWISLMADASIYGVHPGGFHATNVLLHSLGSCLLFLAVAEMTAPHGRVMAASWMVAALYAVHPLHVESVAFVAERKGILSTFFFMLCLAAYPRSLHATQRGWRTLLAGAFVAGLMCKQMLVTLPALLMLLDRWPLERPLSIVRSATEKLHLFAIAAVFSVVAYWAQSAGGALSDLENAPLEMRFKNATISAATYLAKAVWPSGLAPVYPLQEATLNGLRVAVAASFLGIAAAMAFLVRRRAPQCAFGLAWYFVALLPVCGLVQIGSHARADRYTDIPLVGIWWAAVWTARQMLATLPARRQIGLTLAAFTLGSLSIVAFRQTRFWRDSRTLFEHAAAVTENNYIVLNNLGLVYRDLGMPREALPVFEEAVRSRPTGVPARANLGNLLATLGDPVAATEHLREAARLQPADATIHSSLGRALTLQGKHSEAEAACRQALALDANLPTAHGNLGVALMEQGRKDEGLAELESAVRLAPNDIGFLYNLAAGYATCGRSAEAVDLLERVLARQPNQQAALRLRATIESGRAPATSR